MEEKTYLKWYNKVGYGSGDVAGNLVYAFLTSFVMIYLTDTVGLNSGIVGTLIVISKLLDGVTDILFAPIIDKTKSKMGKAKPWMLWPYIGCAITLIATFTIPTSMGEFAQYTWFFIAYTMLNAIFFTANNIAYSALTALVTKNNKERVQLGSYRCIFAFGTHMLIQSITIGIVDHFGGAYGWKVIAIVYAVIGLIINTISALSVNELSEKELSEDTGTENTEEQYGLIEAIKIFVSNKYCIMVCGVYILHQVYMVMLSMGIYYTTYVLHNKNLYGVFSWAINIPQIIILACTPMLVSKFGGTYKVNLTGYIVGTIGRGMVIVAGYMGNIPLMLLFSAVGSLGTGPWQGNMNAVIASCSEYSYLTKKKRVTGTMYSFTSFGTKLGSGFGTALSGWLLAAGGYVGTAEVQGSACINMLCFMYLWLPMIIPLLISFILSGLNVEKVNEELRNKK